MSIDTTAGYFYGWALTYDEVQDMTLKFRAAADNEDDIEDCFAAVNSYQDPHSTAWLFGTWISYFPEPGHWRVFDPEDMLELPDGRDFYDEYAPLLKQAGREDLVQGWYPQVFCVHQIW